MLRLRFERKGGYAMGELAQQGWATPTFFAIGLILLAYTLWMIAEQRRTLVFEIERGAWTYVVAAVLVAAAVANYFIGGRGVQQIAIGFVMFAFAIFLAAVRNGVGRKGIYLDGVRYTWAKVKALRLKKEHGVAVLYYTIGEFERVIRLEGSAYKDVERFVTQIKEACGL